MDSEQEMIFQMVYGLPAWMCRVTGVMEIATAVAVVSSVWGLPLVLVLVGGAMFIHTMRQRQPVAAIPAAVIGAIAYGGILLADWEAPLELGDLPTWQHCVTAWAVGIAGGWAVARLVGHQPNPEAFTRLHVATLESAKQLTSARQHRKEVFQTLPKGSKSL
jgi:hypothetical protein